LRILNTRLFSKGSAVAQGGQRFENMVSPSKITGHTPGCVLGSSHRRGRDRPWLKVRLHF
jgi:hypothetical protein